MLLTTVPRYSLVIFLTVPLNNYGIGQNITAEKRLRCVLNTVSTILCLFLLIITKMIYLFTFKTVFN